MTQTPWNYFEVFLATIWSNIRLQIINSACTIILAPPIHGDIYLNLWMDRIFIINACAWGYKYCMRHLCLLLFIGSLHRLSRWQWWPPMRGCRLYRPPWRPEMGDLSQFFASLTNYMSPDGEFCCCHLVFGVFCPQIHVFWGPMVKKLRNSENNGHLRCVAIIFGNSWTWWEHCVLREQDGSLRISENDGYIVAIIFGNSRLYVAIIFRISWKPQKMDLFAA